MLFGIGAIFAAVKPLNLLCYSIQFDVSKRRSSQVLYRTYVLFQGDFGSPLVASNTLVGIYTWGGGCGNPQIPDAYTKLAAVCYWIVINIGP
jgi:hypothetical protein